MHTNMQMQSGLTAEQRSQDRLQAKALKPERFNGSSKEVRNWLHAMRMYLSATGLLHVSQGVYTAATYLMGPALTWWRIQPESLHITDVLWPAFEERILKEFAPYNVVEEARRRLRNTVQTTSVRDYISRFRTILLDIPDMPEAEQVWQFKEGLKRDVKIQVQIHAPTTMDAVFDVADKVDNAVFSGRREGGSYRPNRRGDSREDPIVINKREAKPEGKPQMNFIKDELANSWQRRGERAAKATQSASRRPMCAGRAGKRDTGLPSAAADKPAVARRGWPSTGPQSR